MCCGSQISGVTIACTVQHQNVVEQTSPSPAITDQTQSEDGAENVNVTAPVRARGYGFGRNRSSDLSLDPACLGTGEGHDFSHCVSLRLSMSNGTRHGNDAEAARKYCRETVCGVAVVEKEETEDAVDEIKVEAVEPVESTTSTTTTTTTLLTFSQPSGDAGIFFTF